MTRPETTTTPVIEEKYATNVAPAEHTDLSNAATDTQPFNFAPPASPLRTTLIMLSLCLAMFLAALDITIVATALPTIARHLHASASQYVWVGSAYTLASTSTTLLWSAFSEIWGRKAMILLANMIFLAGSAISATSVSMEMLIGGRVLQGLGGGGLSVLVSVIIGDLFELRDRAKYYAFTAVVWAVAGGVGPILGGVFTQSVGWRWCFYINLPLDGMSVVLLMLLLKLDTKRTSFREMIQKVDWVGIVTVIGGTVCLLYGLESASSALHSWSSAFVIGLMLTALVLLAFFGVYEWKYAQHPLVQLKMFKSRNNLATLAVAFCHSFVFIAYDYFLPLYFQVVLGKSPIDSGLYIFALLLPLTAFSVCAGFFVKKTGRYQWAIWFGCSFMTLGTGLLVSLSAVMVLWKIILFQIITGIGSGPLFQSPLISLQHHVEPGNVAAATSAFTFLRNLATAMSVVIGGVVLQQSLHSGSLTGEIQSTKGGSVDKEQYAAALSHMWIFYTSLCALGAIAALCISREGLDSARKKQSISSTEEISQVDLNE